MRTYFGRAALFFALSFCLLAGPVFALPPVLKVGVREGVPRVVVASSTAGTWYDASGRVIGHTEPLEGWSVSMTAGRGLSLRGSKGHTLAARGSVRLVPAQTAEFPLVFAAPRWYRGTLELKIAGSGIAAINHISVEGYLYGVVPAEMSAKWPAEALGAQAIAARSYALANLGKHAKNGFDVCATDECQVYRGAGIESLASNSAVDATRGSVLTQGGKVLSAFFHASSGGYTENSEDVWFQKLDHIRAVPDYDQNSPHYEWYKNVPAADLSSRLAHRGIRVGGLRELQTVSRSFSGRVRSVRVIGTRGTKEISGETLRLAAGLRSTLFNMAPRGGAAGSPAEFAFAGRGWGHGLGMSQWGARRLAEAGYNSEQILAHYYPGARISRQSGP
jgi:stage II sporulation protein D